MKKNEPINKPARVIIYAELRDATGYVHMVTFADAAAASAYDADPDGYAALYFGLSRDAYVEWITLSGQALCGATTAKGNPCQQGLGTGTGLNAETWMGLHRNAYCKAHGG